MLIRLTKKAPHQNETMMPSTRNAQIKIDPLISWMTLFSKYNLIEVDKVRHKQIVVNAVFKNRTR